MAVSYDAAGYGENTSSTTSIPNFTVSLTGSNGAVAVTLCMGINNATGISVTIGGVSASLISGSDTGTAQSYRALTYGLATGSTSGSQTVSISWTTACWAAASAVAATSVDQTTPFNNGTFNSSGTGPTASVTITSSTGDLTFGAVACESGTTPTAPTQTQVHADNAGFQVGIGSSRAAGAATVAHQWSTGSGWLFSGVNFNQYTGALEQEGFRWGVDDGNESAHGWEAAQDTSITIADTQSRLLRVLVNATQDPASFAYTLRAQKNGSGGYTAVNVGSTSDVTPTPDATSDTTSGNNTASGSWAVSVPNASTGDLLIFCLAWDDSTTTTDVTEPAGQNGETLSEINATPATDAATETRCKVWYCKCTGAWTSGTITFTPSASEQWAGSAIRIPAGQFDDTTPIGASTTNSSSVDGSNIQCGAFTAGASDGGGRLCVWASADADPQTVATGFTEISNQDIGAVSGGFFTRDTVVSDSESISATTCSTIATDSWCTVAFVIRPYVQTNEVYITTSGNITAGGEATTARLTAPSGKTTSDFVTGRRWDDENGSDSIDITTDDYTEVEWLVYLASTMNANDYVDFRVYAGSTALTTYTVTPRWTIPGVGGFPFPHYPMVHLLVR